VRPLAAAAGAALMQAPVRRMQRTGSGERLTSALLCCAVSSIGAQPCVRGWGAGGTTWSSHRAGPRPGMHGRGVPAHSRLAMARLAEWCSTCKRMARYSACTIWWWALLQVNVHAAVRPPLCWNERWSRGPRITQRRMLHAACHRHVERNGRGCSELSAQA
jgi:hypothetical protein